MMTSIEDIGSIPAKDAMIVWDDHNTNKGSRVTALMVYHRQERAPAAAVKMPCSAGACSFGWLAGDVWQETPLGLFAYMAAVLGFSSEEVKIAALWEFAKIGGQSWAVGLLRELGEKVDD